MSVSLAPRRFVLRLLSGYGVLSVLLAVIGVYGTVSFTIVSRHREIGIRLALGAQRSQIFSIFLHQVLTLALPALVIGTLLIAVAAPLIRDVLFEVESLDPIVIILAAAGLTCVAVSASISPIRRATLLDPTVSLRDD
jgi:ABC-type antimicrobial peptide transport system permease subunit